MTGGARPLGEDPAAVQVVIRGLSKSFGATRALEDAGLEIAAGEVHGLLGENGAGKSTLVKVLSGIVAPDSGEATVGGQDVTAGSPAVSRAAGVATAFQELSLIPNLSVAQNLLLPDLPRGPLGVVSARRTQAGARAVLEKWGLDRIAPDTPVRALSLAEQQSLEITNALRRRPKLLILDEPTAALPDTTWLFGHVRAATEAGTAILYISHRMSEIVELCSRVTVLRSGRVVGTQERAGFDREAALRMMVGRPLSVAYPDKRSATEAPSPLLRVDDLRVGRRRQGVSLEVGAGEVVGVAGLEGQGQRELFYALAGLERVHGGVVELDGERVGLRSPRQAQRSSVGIGLVPEDRQREGLFKELSSRTNIAMPVLRRVTSLGVVIQARERAVTGAAAQRTNIRVEYLDRPVAALSGGNQQKVVVARTLLSGARCLLLFDPCRGVDAATKLELYRLARDVADEGGCVLVYSTELAELVGLCDRAYVMYDGAIIGSCSDDELEEERLLSLMLQAGPSAAPAGAQGAQA